MALSSRTVAFRVKILLILNIFARSPASNGLCLLLIQEKT